MLRHSCGFYLADQGYGLRLIQDYLRHRDPKHTVRDHPSSGQTVQRALVGILST